MSLPVTNEGKLFEEDLAHLEDEQLAEEVVDLLKEADRCTARAVHRLEVMDRRRSFEREGYLSLTSWLRDRCRRTAGAAQSFVAVARSLRSMPKARRAYLQGKITFPSVQMLGIAAAAHPETFSRHESMLVEQAKRLSPSDQRRALDYWTQAADGEAGIDAADRKFRRRKLFISQTIDGMVRLDGDLDPEGGATVLTAIRSLSGSAALDPHDDRTGPRRRADALVDICRLYLDGGNKDSEANRPHLSVIVDLQTLVDGVGKISEFESGAVIDAETARRLACDASVNRVIVNGDSAPLDVGRKTRTVPAGLRRALVIRDRTCTYDGCDRPPQWCEAHHIEPWAQGGETSLANLRLLCRRHHRMMHPEPRGADP